GARSDLLLELLPARDRRSVELHHLVERVQTGARGRQIRRDYRYLRCARHRRNADAAVLDGLDRVGFLVDRRNDAQGLAGVIALHFHGQRLAGVGADLLLQSAPAFDWLAVDADDPVAGTQSRLRRRRLRLDVPHLRGEVLVRRREDDEVQGDREREVRRRPREGDHALLPGRLLEEAPPPILGRHLLVRVVSGELHVSAEREERDAIFGLSGGESEEPGPESDGKADGLDPDGLADQQVPQLVEEHDDADDQREREQGEACRLYKSHGSASLNVHCAARQHRQVRRRAHKRTKGALKSSASMRSSRPPWPGSRFPLSFAPKARLSIDSDRSPTGPRMAAPAPISAAPQAGTEGSQICRTTMAPAMLPAAPPSAPSQVLLGEIRS